MYKDISRNGVESAEPLEFPDRKRSEKDVSITIEAGPAGLTVRVDYLGTLGSIPAAIERLRAAGVLELVSGARIPPAVAAAATGASPAPKQSKKTVPVEYDADGSALCPVHRRELTEGQYGYYCSAKARAGDVADKRGYCGLKFDL